MISIPVPVSRSHSCFPQAERGKSGLGGWLGTVGMGCFVKIVIKSYIMAGVL